MLYVCTVQMKGYVLFWDFASDLSGVFSQITYKISEKYSTIRHKVCQISQSQEERLRQKETD